ncbi:MAG: LPXTG cell wall anchor domain-containing protein, partial [Eubacteriales bacterium]|nr:LPXTG cell wall anchor domain-containing protein [Eubacteriales bacterium]
TTVPTETTTTVPTEPTGTTTTVPTESTTPSKSSSVKEETTSSKAKVNPPAGGGNQSGSGHARIPSTGERETAGFLFFGLAMTAVFYGLRRKLNKDEA